MSEPTIATVAEAILRRAQRQGYVVPRDIRAELQTAFEQHLWLPCGFI